jgi:SEC-C motif-containing protein
MAAKPDTSKCPCGSGKAFAQCCEPFLRDNAVPPTAEALMRSRYTAYVLADGPYLLATWHPSTRPAKLNLDGGEQPQWIGLSVKRHEVKDENHARVEFVARYRVNGKAHKLLEVSEFASQGGRWFYCGAHA